VEFYGNLTQQLDRYDVSVLINNVGVLTNDEFMNLKMDDIETCIGVNVYPVTYLTHHYIRKMQDRHKSEKHRSLIINIGSLSSAVPLKEFSIYGATKRFVEFFSRAVAYEVRDAITLVTFLPGNTNTN